MRITIEMLQAKNIHPDQIKLFSKLFPNGTGVTYGNIEIAMKAGLDIDMMAKKLLPHMAWAEYIHLEELAWTEYKHLEKPAWDEYKRIQGQVRAEYLYKCGEAFINSWRKQYGGPV
jgi:hypothetical protein